MDTSITFPGIPAIVPAARRFVRGILEGSPRTDDMELIAAELISNAIQHSPSGEEGGEFMITLRTEPGWARVEVADPGTGQWHPRDADAETEYGRGLVIIAASGNGSSVPTALKWVGQRRSNLRWIIADSPEELARLIAADYAACPVARAAQT